MISEPRSLLKARLNMKEMTLTNEYYVNGIFYGIRLPKIGS